MTYLRPFLIHVMNSFFSKNKDNNEFEFVRLEDYINFQKVEADYLRNVVLANSTHKPR